MPRFEEVQLNQVAEIIGRGITPKYTDSSGIQVVNQRCIRNGTVDLSLARVHDESKRRVREDKILINGDVVVCSTGVGTLGRTAGIRNLSTKVTADSHVTIARPRENVDPDWLAYSMQYWEPVIEGMAQGSTGQTELSRLDLGLLRLQRPPHEIQVKIGKTLRLIDDKIESNQEIIRISGGLIDEIAKLEAKSLPKVSLSNLVNLSRSGVVIGKLGDDLVDHYSLPAFDNGALPVREKASSIKSNKLGLTHETVLVSRLNPRFNRTWLVFPSSGVTSLTSTEFAPLVAKGAFGVELPFLAVRSTEFQDELPRRVTGTSGSHQRVRPDDLLSIEVPDYRQTDKKTLDRIRTLLVRVDEAKRESQTLARMRDTLLPELLSGRIDPDEIGNIVRSAEISQ